ncbi:Peroxidase, family 2-domain-containing protein [Mycena maculata]|uniref:Peroxidase, family 2-domain-containing protein n=1 Tax=Mycena maculata TaxID=230809 RepID=A0AAD7HYT4_9AGAR|nr:Peroxidase, family 2-domain-containing protein [Mycena maculata]
MKSSTSFTLLALTSVVTGFPAYGTRMPLLRDDLPAGTPEFSSRDSDPAVGVFQAPNSTDVRSPCPGLNALANHGYLPRDGTNIHITDIVSQMDSNLGIASDFGLIQVAGATVLGAMSIIDGLGLGLKSFESLTESHNTIEHDASLTRDDTALGSNTDKNQTLIDQLFSYSKDNLTLTPTDIAEARQARIKDSFTRNPNVTLHKLQTDACWREAGLLTMVLGDQNGNIRLDWAREFLVDEKLPTDLGWSAPSPAHGIIDIEAITQTYTDLGQSLNAADGNFPLEF